MDAEATLVCGLSMTVTACSDDDDDNNGQEQRSDIDPLDNDEAHNIPYIKEFRE